MKDRRVHRGILLRRGQVWIVDLSKEEERKKGIFIKPRPFVIVQAQQGMGSDIILMAPVSSTKKHRYPFLQSLYIDRPSSIHYNGVRPIPKEDLLEYKFNLPRKDIVEMDLRLAVPLGLTDVNFLHLKDIEVRQKSSEEFTVTVYKVFETYEIDFNFDQFKSSFEDTSSLRDMSLLKLVLKSLEGLKFIYGLDQKKVYLK